MNMWRTASLTIWMLTPAVGLSQVYSLVESNKTDDCFRITIETGLTGALKVVRDGKEERIPLVAKNEHIVVERVLKTEKGLIRQTGRFYEKALSHAQIGQEKAERGLRDERRLMVAQRLDDSLLCFSPSGPLTQPELEVSSEHFDTLFLGGMLPTKDVALNESWAIGNATAQAICLFEGLVSHDLTGKLIEVANGRARIAVAGKASGIELGASVNLVIEGQLDFDLNKQRVIAVEWKQKDVREPGPVSPASEIESATTLRRVLLEETPKELADASLFTAAAGDESAEALRLLQYHDFKGAYRLLCTREWRLVGQNNSHLVLRYLDRGEFIAQATIATWTKDEAGKHLSPEEFKRQIGSASDWVVDEIVEEGALPGEPGRWIYRVTARGVLEGTKVVQHFYLVAASDGRQLAVTFTMKPGNAAKIGAQDLAIIHAIEFANEKK